MEKETSFYDQTYFDGIGKSNYVSYTKGSVPFLEYAKEIENLLEYINVSPGTVLDIGCAKGFLVRVLRRRGTQAFGIDCSEYAISESPESIRPFVCLGDARDLPYRDKVFDVAVSFDVLEHFNEENARRVLREAARVSRYQFHRVNTGWDEARTCFNGDESHVLRLSLEGWRTLAQEDGCDNTFFAETGKPSPNFTSR